MKAPFLFCALFAKKGRKKQCEKLSWTFSATIATKGGFLVQKVTKRGSFGVKFGAILGVGWHSENRVPACTGAQFTRLERGPTSIIFWIFSNAHQKHHSKLNLDDIFMSVGDFGVSIGVSRAAQSDQKPDQKSTWDLQATPSTPGPSFWRLQRWSKVSFLIDFGEMLRSSLEHFCILPHSVLKHLFGLLSWECYGNALGNLLSEYTRNITGILWEFHGITKGAAW